MRKIFLQASPLIEEGIKWNSLSFRTTDWFATYNRRVTEQVQFVLHLGAKVRNDSAVRSIGDAGGLLKWLADDRALLTIPAAEIEEREGELVSLIQEWVKYV